MLAATLLQIANVFNRVLSSLMQIRSRNTARRGCHRIMTRSAITDPQEKHQTEKGMEGKNGHLCQPGKSSTMCSSAMISATKVPQTTASVHA